jgi:lipoprotein-anchoring transpeptidase ErfK/SrfK
MSNGPKPALRIVVSRTDKILTLTETSGSTTVVLLSAAVVSGCEDSGTPAGEYVGGKWIKDKTNATHGPKPWSKDPWGNPYGPFFLPLNKATTNVYTTYGIHGTRGPLVGNFEKPPVPQRLLGLFLDADDARFLYCSHGCVRLSNQNITKLFELTTQGKYIGVKIAVTIK